MTEKRKELLESLMLSYSPRIKYGINSGGYPEFTVFYKYSGFPTKTSGMTNRDFYSRLTEQLITDEKTIWTEFFI
jgi:hypothetical protein